MAQRLQVNVRLEPEDLVAIEDIRKALSPIPTVTEVIKQAVREKRDRERKRARK